VLAGVASGLGDYFNVDPVVFRVAFVVLSFTGGVGLLLYVALWILVPPAGASESIGQAALRRPNARTWIGIGLVLLAVLVLGGELGMQRPGIAWGLVLITLGVVLLIREPSAGVGGAGPRAPAGAVPATGAQGQADATAAGPAPAAWSGGPAAAGWGPPPPAGATDTEGGWGGPPAPGDAAAPGRTWGGPPPGGVDGTARAWGEPPPDGWTVRRNRSNLGWVTLAVAFLAVGVAAFLDNVGMVELTIGRVLALFLTVIGAGLVVGAVLHQRSILLVLLGVLLVPVVVLASVLNVPLRGGVGPRHWQPGSVAQINSQYELASGDLVIDLSGVHFGKEPTRVNARVGAGRLAVYLPQDVPVEMDAKTGIGVVQFPDRQDEGGVQVSTHASATGSERVGRLSLDLEAGYGVVQVVRGSPPPDAWNWDKHIQGWDGGPRRSPAAEVGR
jgi:phage shock protein PspC (stress-responsive transcriptional regulator)